MGYFHTFTSIYSSQIIIYCCFACSSSSPQRKSQKVQSVVLVRSSDVLCQSFQRYFNYWNQEIQLSALIDEFNAIRGLKKENNILHCCSKD